MTLKESHKPMKLRFKKTNDGYTLLLDETEIRCIKEYEMRSEIGNRAIMELTLLVEFPVVEGGEK